jgi:hypothetical protein
VAAAGGRVGTVTQGLIDRFKHSRQITVDVVIPESKNSKPFVGKGFMPPCVPCLMRIEIMLSAIDFDYKPVPQTHEVNDVAFAR